MVLIIICGVVTACGSGSEPGNETGGTRSETVTDDGTVKTKVPKSYRLDGQTFTILCTGWAGYSPMDITDVFAEEDSRDAIESAAFYRLIYINDRLGCSVEEHDIVSGAEHDNIAASNRSGDGLYDIALIRSQNYFTLVATGALLDLDSLTYADFSQPYWNPHAYESLSVLGRHFAATSDITINDELATWIMFFNKGMIADNQMDSPYDLVNEKQWTLDKVYSMAKVVAKDVNGDGMKWEDDIWGVTHIRDNFIGLLNSSGIEIARNNKQNVPEFTINSQLNVEKILHIFDFLYDTDVCINIHIMGAGHDETQLFMENRALFYLAGVYCGNTLRNMDYEYGIVPYPMYNEQQDGYKSGVSGLFLTLVTVPYVTPDRDAVSAFLEEFTLYGYNKIRPVFYNSLLERKIAYDEESREMIGIIFDNIVYDTGNIGNFATIGEQLLWMTNDYDRNISKFLASKLPSAEKRVNKMVDTVGKYSDAE